MGFGKIGIPGVFSVGEVLRGPGGGGSRQEDTSPAAERSADRSTAGEYRARSPTRSERMNRALAELGPAAFKIHALLWQWRGAPGKGLLPFFTIHSLGRFCRLSRPTVRQALAELSKKGYIERREYNVHHKNALYALVAVRKIPRPAAEKKE